MKKFTVKDFITYTGPCFSCQSKISFQIGVFNKQDRQSKESIYLTPNVTNDCIDIDLKINYRSGLNVKIFPKTNKFTTSSMRLLTKYLEEHNLFLRSKCDECHTNVDSEALEFNLLKEFVVPVTISDERLIVKDDKYLYELYSFFDNSGQSIVMISHINKVAQPIRIELPLLPMYKLKNKERFIQKMKTYITFS